MPSLDKNHCTPFALVNCTVIFSFPTLDDIYILYVGKIPPRQIPLFRSASVTQSFAPRCGQLEKFDHVLNKVPSPWCCVQIADCLQDRLAGIDVRRTFDLDGSGYVSPAVLRRPETIVLQKVALARLG